MSWTLCRLIQEFVVPSPFPGMDPYLEDLRYWPTFQQQFVSALSDALQPALSDKYRLRVGTRVYYTQQVLFTSIVREEQREPFLEVRQRTGADRLVTLIEMASPANRLHFEGRRRFELRRQEARTEGAHLVELELVLQGQTVLDADLSALAERAYVCCVTRSGRPIKQEPHGIALSKRLPRIRLPLLADERDLVLDVQALVNRVYDRCFESKIDYHKDPSVPLSDEDRTWLDQLLRAEKLR
jgi:hypothetical protein